MAPRTGQVHSPSTCDQAHPGLLEPAQDLLGLLRARGRGRTRTGRHRLGGLAQLGDPDAGVRVRRDHAGCGQPTVADDVDRPAAVVLASGRHQLGAAR